MRRIAVALCILMLLTGCGKTDVKYSSTVRFAAVYTSSATDKSRLIFTDEEGREVYSREFDKQGIFNIIRTGDNLKLPVRFSNEIVSFDLNERNEKIGKTLDFPLYYSNMDSGEFTIYNSDKKGDIDYLTYEVKSKDRVVQRRIRGFPQCYTIHGSRAYVQTDDVPVYRQYINIIDLDSLEVRETIDAGCEVAGDIKVIDGWLFLTDITDCRIIGISLNNPEERKVKNLMANMPQFIIPYKGHIVIVHSSYITILDNNLEVKGTMELRNKVLRAKLFEDKLFLLSQDEGGLIIKVNIDSLAVEKVIRLGERGELLVQDFEVF